MGRPSGLARTSAPADSNPHAAALMAEFLMNSLLEILGIHASTRIELVWSMFIQPTVLSHDSQPMNERLEITSCRRLATRSRTPPAIQISGGSSAIFRLTEKL